MKKKQKQLNKPYRIFVSSRTTGGDDKLPNGDFVGVFSFYNTETLRRQGPRIKSAIDLMLRQVSGGKRISEKSMSGSRTIKV